jgi:outer membrane receptor protein involved in Fe transport
MHPEILRLSVIPAFVAAAIASAAAQAAETKDLPLLPTVVVVGVTPLPGADVDPDHVAGPVQTATGDDIERSRALDIAEYMRRSLGSVQVNDIQNNALQPDVSFRGFTASPLLGTPQGLSVYLDGMRLNQSFGDVVSWDLIPREAIASMALMPGSNPLFGLNTLGGALALRSRDGFSDAGYAAGLEFGSNARRRANLSVSGNTDSGYHWFATANRLKDDGWRDASPTDASQVFGKWGWRGAQTDVSLTAAWADTDLTGNGLQDVQFLRKDYASVYTKPDETRNQSWLLNLVASHRVDDTLTISGNVYYREIDTTTLNGDLNDASLGESLYQPNLAERNALAAAGLTGFPASGETQGNTPFPKWRCIANVLLNDEPNEKCNGLINRTGTDQRDFGVSAQASWNGKVAGRDNLFTLGGGIVDSRAHFAQTSQFAYLAPDRSVVPVDGPGAFADGTQDSENAFDSRVELSGQTQVFSLFASNSTQLPASVRLTLSARFDRSVVDNDDAITPENEPGTLTAKHTFNRFNPAVGITFHPLQGATAYMGYTQGSRAPSAIELGCADPENPCRLPNAMAGDPPLDAVVTRTIETGIRGKIRGSFTWNAGVFRADSRHDIMFVADDTSGFGYFRNFGKTRRQGIEMGGTGTLGAWTFGANYTLLDATYQSAEELLGGGNSANDEGRGFEGLIEIEPGNRIPLIPRHMFKAFTEWQVLSGLSVTADFMAVSGSYARGNENNTHQPDGIFYLGQGRTGGYGIVNLGLQYQPLQGLTLFAQVNNLMDRRYYTAAQLGSTGFDSAGNFVARPFAGPIIDGERPITGTTFFGPGTPRAFLIGARYTVGR